MPVTVCRDAGEVQRLTAGKRESGRYMPCIWEGELPEPMSAANVLVMERAVLQMFAGALPEAGVAPLWNGERVEIYAHPFEDGHLFMALLPQAAVS